MSGGAAVRFFGGLSRISHARRDARSCIRHNVLIINGCSREHPYTGAKLSFLNTLFRRRSRLHTLLGLTPNCFLKQVLKYLGSENPTI